jgi:O-antigen/teichoic acid export membrane protein
MAEDPELLEREPARAGVEQPQPQTASRRQFGHLVARLSLLNGFVAAAGFITGPLQAHALGAGGRGDLAAILVPSGLSAMILGFGMPSFVTPQAARGRPLGPLVGTMAVVAALGGVVGALIGIPLAFLLAGGRDVVLVFLLINFALLPLVLCQQVFFGVAVALERWDLVTYVRLIPTVVSVIALVVLAILHEITVTTGAIVATGGSLLSLIPLLPLARRIEGYRFDRAVLREGVPFGLRAWLGTVTSNSNSRLDQLLMVRLVPSFELGLYTVAVTVSTMSSLVSSAISGALIPRVSTGDHELAWRAHRVTLATIVVASIGIAAVTSPVLNTLFGHDFGGAVVMTWILLVASIPRAGTGVLADALTASGRPGQTMVGELIALVVTVPGLILLLPSMGGEGAALVSVVAYALSFMKLLSVARRHLGGRYVDYLLITRGDIAWTARFVRSMLRLKPAA